ncbi:MAG: hypothetical protein VYE64_06565 [Planctomycetota bacterium]|nr:hypothetical protein [Planctomycetota bacterium]
MIALFYGFRRVTSIPGLLDEVEIMRPASDGDPCWGFIFVGGYLADFRRTDGVP